jgi:hypothetical protein
MLAQHGRRFCDPKAARAVVFAPTQLIVNPRNETMTSSAAHRGVMIASSITSCVLRRLNTHRPLSCQSMILTHRQ